VAICGHPDNYTYECFYFINGQHFTATSYLLAKGGVFGVLFDPVIVQVPADVLTVTATYDDNGVARPLQVSRLPSFHASPDITVTAEAGQTFLILELPPAVAAEVPSGDPEAGLTLSYTLSYSREVPAFPPPGPQTVKLMLTGKAVVNGHSYYVPLLPCETDFANLPPLELPASGSPQNLQPALGAWLEAHPMAPCDHEAYYFNNAPPPPIRVFLPGLWR
jgi:hypothetical protein